MHVSIKERFIELLRPGSENELVVLGNHRWDVAVEKEKKNIFKKKEKILRR